jgi:hypothetical protein
MGDPWETQSQSQPQSQHLNFGSQAPGSLERAGVEVPSPVYFLALQTIFHPSSDHLVPDATTQQPSADGS